VIARPELWEIRQVGTEVEFVYRCGDRFASALVALVAGRPRVEFPHYGSDLGSGFGDPAADEAVVAETMHLIAALEGQAVWQAFRREAK
jgi:hypothetical protein